MGRGVDCVDLALTTAAALVTEPAVRPSGESRSAPKDASNASGDDSFAKVLDAEVAAAQDTATAARPAPAPAPSVVPKAATEISAVTSQTSSASPEDVFAAAQAEATAGKGAAPDRTLTPDSVDVETATASPAATKATSTQATQAAQTASMTALLAIASGAATSTDEGAQPGTTAKDSSTPDGEAATVGILAGLDVPQAAPPVTTAAATVASASTDSAKIEGATQSPAPAIPSLETPVTLPGVDLPDAHSAEPGTQAESAAAKQPAQEHNSQKPALPSAQTLATATTVPNAKAAPDAVATTANTTAAPLSAQQAATIQGAADATRTTTTPQALQSAPAATVQVYSRIIERADGRAQRFEVRLDPAELGRVDVRIEIGADRKVHAVLAAHDSAALSDLMRGQRSLERALAGAGIDLADNGVRFELATDSGRSNAGQQQTGDGNSRNGQTNVWRNFETVTVPTTAEAAAVTSNAWRPQRLDLVA